MPGNVDLEKFSRAVTEAVMHKPELMTGDAISALTKGHGMLNIAGFCSANAIADELLEGKKLEIRALDKPETTAEKIIESGVQAAKKAGADASNAALITAALCYVAGSNSRDGVPSGNRKLGALARLKAGAQKGGVALLPTPKSNNKISGFPAVSAIYNSMVEGKLISMDGKDAPPGVGGGPLYGHSSLGEDYVFPELAGNAAKIGAQAMMKAYAGAGINPNSFISAIIGAAAALEIVHPDASVSEEYGPLFEVGTPYVAGKAAVEATGLMDKLHFIGSSKSMETARVVGDLGLILKDIGTPTVIGMMAFNEIMGCFKEARMIGAGGSGGPVTAPLGHQLADASIALLVISETGSMEKAAEAVIGNKEKFIDPEMSTIAANTLARKAEEVKSGPVTKAVIKATNSGTIEAIRHRAKYAYDELKKGRDTAKIVRDMETWRINRVEEGVARMFSQRLAKDVSIKVIKIKGGARRHDEISRRFYVLDADVDISVTVDGKKTVFKGLAHKVIPDAVINKKKELLDVIPLASVATVELLVSGHTLINLLVPAAADSILKGLDPEEVYEEVMKGAIVSGGLPSVKGKVKEVAKIAADNYTA